MMKILTFLVCITLAMTAPAPGQTIINAGGMFRFSKKGISENN